MQSAMPVYWNPLDCTKNLPSFWWWLPKLIWYASQNWDFLLPSGICQCLYKNFLIHFCKIIDIHFCKILVILFWLCLLTDRTSFTLVYCVPGHWQDFLAVHIYLIQELQRRSYLELIIHVTLKLRSMVVHRLTLTLIYFYGLGKSSICAEYVISAFNNSWITDF